MQLIYKIIYHPAINRMLRTINKALYSLLPEKLTIPPSGVLRIAGPRERTLKVKTNQTSYLTHLLFWNGYEQFEYTPIFVVLIQKVNVFYDIGANIGYYSLLAALVNPNTRTVGFEPASGPLFFFRENVRLNNFDNITIEDVALSDQMGELTFYEIRNKKYPYLKHNLAGESNAGSKTKSRDFVPVVVRTTTLENYVDAHESQRIDLIKMDTEGTEHHILAHAGRVLKDMKPIVICETLFNTIESELESIFSQYGYEFYNHTREGLKKTDTIIRTVDNGIRNCFFVHPEKFDLIKEFVIS